MDPDANLKEQFKLARKILTSGASEDVVGKAIRFAELVEALDEWIAGGGFLPKRWSR